MTDRYDWTRPDHVALFDELTFWSALAGRLLLRHVPLERGITALDVGCGTGFPLIELAMRLGPSSAVHAIDPWAAALDRVRAKIAFHGLDNVHPHLGDASAMPWPDGTFDLIVSNLGVNNFADPAAAIAECHRVAKPGATIVLTSNTRGHWREFYAVFDAALTELGMEDCRAKLAQHIDHRASAQGLSEMLEAGGFTTARVIELEEPWRTSDGTAFLAQSLVAIGFRPAWEELLPPDRYDDVFAALAHGLDRLAGENGVLTLTVPFAYVESKRQKM